MLKGRCGDANKGTIYCGDVRPLTTHVCYSCVATTSIFSS
jgi:hypothetical protein